MSETNTILGGNPAATLDDAIEYLSLRTNKECPACGYNKWSVAASFDDGNRNGKLTAIGLIAVDVSSGAVLSRGVPVVIASCRKCAFARIHGMVEISRWLADGKPEFVEDDEA